MSNTWLFWIAVVAIGLGFTAWAFVWRSRVRKARRAQVAPVLRRIHAMERQVTEQEAQAEAENNRLEDLAYSVEDLYLTNHDDEVAIAAMAEKLRSFSPEDRAKVLEILERDIPSGEHRNVIEAAKQRLATEA